MLDGSKTPKQKLADWFNHPKTDRYAWRDFSLKQIAEQANVSTTAVVTHLPGIVQQRFPMVTTIAVFNAYRKKSKHGKPGCPIPDAEIQQIQRLRKEYTILETAQIIKRSPATVQKYSSKRYKRDGRNRQK